MPLHDIARGNPDSDPSYPGYEIGYDQITSIVNVTSTTEATGTTIISCNAHTFDGNPVIAEFYSPGIVPPTPTGAFVSVSLFESSTQITELCTVRAIGPGANTAIIPVFAVYRFTPSAGSHTYTVTAFASSTTGTPNVQAGAGGTGANPPAFCRFVKV